MSPTRCPKSGKRTMAAPDLIEPFIGWKGLLADPKGGLWSPQQTTRWPVGKPLIAKCLNHPKIHKPPVASCGCGIYAVKTFEDLKHHRYNWGGPISINVPTYPEETEEKVWVLAEVALYGEVVPGRIGWRASKAAPQVVYVSAMNIPLGGLIRKRYGVDLGLIDRFTGKRMMLGRRH